MAKDKQAQTDPAASEATEVAENQAPPNDNNAVGETAEVPEGGGQSGPRAETDEAKGHIEPGLHGPYEPTELELMLARLKTGEEVTAEKLKVFKNAELVDMASKIGTKVNKKAKKADIITAITSKIPATDKGDDDAGAKAEDGKPAGDTDAGEGAKYPYAKSADVPAGTAYCVQCSTQLNPDGEGNLPSPCPGGCGTAIQDVTPHEGHYIGHPVGAKPEICSACGADLTGKADEDDTEGEEAKEVSEAEAWIDNGVLHYRNPYIQEVTVAQAELDKLRASEYGPNARTSVELDCISGCNQSYKKFKVAVKFFDKVIEAIEAGDTIPMQYPVHPSRNHRGRDRQNCFVKFWRAQTEQQGNLLASARVEPFTEPENEDERRERQQSPYTIKNGRVYVDDGTDYKACSFEVDDARTNPKKIVHLYPCAGPDCNSVIYLIAGWALEQAEKAAQGEEFGHPANCARSHDRCKEKVREANRARREAEHKASSGTTTGETAETETPEPEVAAEATTETPPQPAEAGTTPPPAPPQTPAFTPPTVTPPAQTPQVAPTGDGTAATIAALGQYMGGLGTFAQALRPEPVDLPGFMSGAADIARETAAAGARGNEALASVTKTQAEQMGKALDTALDQNGKVVTQMLGERKALTADEIAEATHRRIFSEVDPDGRRVIPIGGQAQSAEEDQVDQPVGPPPTETIPRS